MNFVFHRHLAARDLGSPAAGLGAMLPDLWRMADRRMRARPGISPDSSVDASVEEGLGPLLAGVEHHLWVDGWFHRHPVFTVGERRTAEAFAEIEAPKIRLFAHVAWEMVLDGALVRRLGGERAVAEVRRSLAAVGKGELRRAARLHRPSIEEEQLGALAARLEELFLSLSRGDWITGYAHGRGLAARLDGVRRRFELPRLDDSARRRAAASLGSLLVEAEGGLDELLAVSFDAG